VKAYQVGAAVPKHDAVLITGGCPGLPYEAGRGARANGGLVIGISPDVSIDEHRIKYNSPVEGFDVLIYTGSMRSPPQCSRDGSQTDRAGAL